MQAAFPICTAAAIRRVEASSCPHVASFGPTPQGDAVEEHCGRWTEKAQRFQPDRKKRLKNVMNFNVNNNVTEIIVYKYKIYQILLNTHINLAFWIVSFNKIVYQLK